MTEITLDWWHCIVIAYLVFYCGFTVALKP